MQGLRSPVCETTKVRFWWVIPRRPIPLLPDRMQQAAFTTGDVEVLDGFVLIDKFRIVRETRDGRMQDVTLSDWVFNAIRHKEVLTLHRATIFVCASRSSGASTRLRASTAASNQAGRSAWIACARNAGRTRATRNSAGWSPRSCARTKRTRTCPTMRCATRTRRTTSSSRDAVRRSR